MDFFTSLEISNADEDKVQPNALRAHNLDTTTERAQTETQKSETVDNSKDYSLYQRDLLLGVNDDDDSPKEPTKAPDTSYMAGIRKRLLEKKKLEQERKEANAAQTTKMSQEIKVGNNDVVTSTQILAKTNAETQEINNETNTPNNQEIQTKDTQIILTSIIDSSTQVIRSIAEPNDEESDEDDKLTQRMRTNVLNESSDSENENFNFVKKKPLVQIVSEDENYDDDDQIPAKKRFDRGDIQKTETEKRLENTVLEDLFPKNDIESNSGIVTEQDISRKIENYQSLSREERIEARLEIHKRAREEQEHVKEQQLKETGTDRQEEISMTDEHFVSTLEKKQKEKAKLRLKLKQKEKMERIQQAKLIQEAADAIKHFDSSKLTKEKLLEQLETNDKVDDQAQNNPPLNVTQQSSPQKPLKELTTLNPITIIKRGGLHSKKVVQLDSSEEENSSDYEDENLNDKLRLLELKRKLVKKNRRQREKLTRESSLDERIKKHITLQMKKNIKTDKSTVDEKMSTEDMVVELLHRDQMRDVERLKREEFEAKKKKKEKKMIENGVFPSHDDDPEFSEYSENENSDEAEIDDIRKLKGYDPLAEEGEENNAPLHNNSNDMHDLKEDSFVMTQNIESLNLKTTQTDAFKKLGISMTQLFENKTQLSQNNMLTKSEKFKVMKGETNGLKKIGEINEESTEIMNDLSVDNSTSFLSKMVNIEEEESSFLNSPREKKSNNLKLLLESQAIELGTQADASTQIDAAAVEAEALREHFEEEDEEEEEERIQFGRKKKMEDNDSDVAQASEGEEADDEEETEAEREKRLELIKLAKERERNLRAKREKEMKDIGLHKIMENEADESEDEFKGIGGDEGDISEAENSEDEKIIDDASTIKNNANEIRKKLLEKELEEDKALVEKTYKDIKTHKLRERRAKDGVYDMELSDEDDDEYFKLKMLVRQQMEKRQMELEGRNKVTLSENNPQKPFFDAMVVKLPSRVLSFKKAKSSPSVISDLVSDDESKASQSLNETDNKKRPMNQLLMSPKKRRKIPDPKPFNVDSLKQHDIREEARVSVLNELSSDDEDGSSALKKVKSNSMIKLSRENSYKRRSQVTISQTTNEEVDALNVLSSRTTSITASFKNATKKKVRKGMFTGNVVKEVMVTTTAKPVLNSKSSVTKLVAKDSFMNRANILDEAADKMSSMLAASRKKGIRKLGTSKFRR